MPVVQAVVGHIMLADVGPDVILRPVQHRVVLDQAEHRIVLDRLNGSSIRRLIAAAAGDPGLHALQGAPQGVDLAHGAAHLAEFDRTIEQIDAVFVDHRLHFLAIGKDDLQLHAVMFSQTLHQLIGFLRQPAGIQRQHPNAGHVFLDEVNLHHPFRAQRARIYQPVAVLLARLAKQGHRRVDLVLQRHLISLPDPASATRTAPRWQSIPTRPATSARRSAAWRRRARSRCRRSSRSAACPSAA